MITGEQVSVARGLMRLSGYCGVSDVTIQNFERGKTRKSAPDVEAIRRALELGGVEFTQTQPGVRLKAMITGEQVKAARKLLGWSQVKLAGQSGFADATLAKFERGEIRPSVLSLTTIKRALEAAGVEFTNGVVSGVRPMKEG